MKQTGETETDAPPSVPPSSQPTAEDYIYEPMQHDCNTYAV